MTPSPSRGLISTQTKTIKKSKPTPSPTTNNSDTKAKKYKTFGDSQKQNILNDLWKGAIQRLKLDLNDTSSCDLLELLGGIPLEEYNVLLRKTLTTHVEGFAYATKVLTQWRKKVKSWIQNQGKPETRGGLVVSSDVNDDFRCRVIEILRKIPCRCFPTLQKEILVVLEEFHNQTQDPTDPKPFNPKTCSKHWWFNYIRKNEDIKDMWEALPLERTLKKQQKNSNSSVQSNSTTVSSPTAEEDTNLSLNPESRTVSTKDDNSLEAGSRYSLSLSSSPIRGESYQDNCFGNFDYGTNIDVQMETEMEKAPESPSRYFESNDDELRDPFSIYESDDVVFSGFHQQTGSPNQERIEEDNTLYAFLDAKYYQ